MIIVNLLLFDISILCYNSILCDNINILCDNNRLCDNDITRSCDTCSFGDIITSSYENVTLFVIITEDGLCTEQECEEGGSLYTARTTCREQQQGWY